MNKYFVQYVAVFCLLGFSSVAMAYSTNDCSIAQDLADIGVVNDQSNCRDYNLDRTIYRQEVAALALRVAEQCGRIDDVPTLSDYRCQNIFSDVSASRPNSWACRSVEILAENDIITTNRRDNSGRSVFRPTQDITRAEALSIIMDSANLDFRGTIYDDWRFSNTGAVSWQKPVMQYADDNDIISSLSSFGPNNIAYRREVFSYAQKSIENCLDENQDDNNNDSNNFYVTADDASPTTNQWVDLTVKARDGTSTDTGYRGTVNFDVYYRSGSSSSWIKTTSSSYYEMDEDYDNGYTFTSSNDGQKIFSNLIRFKKNNYSYKVIAYDEDDEDIEGYKIFTVGSTSGTGDTDNFYVTADDASPTTNQWVDLTVKARDGTSTDTGYRGTVNFDVYYRSGSSSSWIKTTSSSYYEMDEDYDNGYTFTSSNDGQKIFSNLIRFKKNNYSYKVIAYDEDDEDIEGYKIFTVGSTNNDTCNYGEYESGNSCYTCNNRPSNAYYLERGSCDWECNSGYVERNGYCESEIQNCAIGQYFSGNSCYNCTTKPSSAYYTEHGTCDWECQSGYYRDGNTCVSNYQTCGIGQYPNGSYCQTCTSAPSNSYYTTAGSCSWTCNANYYPSGNQCIPYTQNCSIGQYLSGNVCANCTSKPNNSAYSQIGTCDWTCDYGFVRDGNSCVQSQAYAWYNSGWSTCSASCGGGTQYRTVECHNQLGITVSNYLCSGITPPTTQTCNIQACTNYSWKIGNWGTCVNGTRDRTVLCERDDGVLVASSYCNSNTKPATSESCNSTTYSWNTGAWGTCTNNQQTRSVTCLSSGGQTVSDGYCTTTKPTTVQSCNSMTYSWQTHSWGTCSASCGGGIQTRIVQCEDNYSSVANSWLCSGITPPTTQTCNIQACTNYSWKIGNWGTCVNGTRDRTVLCERDDGVLVASSYCNSNTKPATSESCNSTTYSWNTGAWGTCTNNQQTRSVTCLSSGGQTVSDGYCTTTKPTTVQSCNSMTYSWYRGDPNTCGVTCDSVRTVLCRNNLGQTVADSYCTTSKPGHICARGLAWVATDSTKSCDTVCNQANSCWVADENQQACASGERMPTWGTFNYLFGTIPNPTIGGYYEWQRNGAWYCGSTNYYQEPAYRATEKLVSCLCQ